MNRRSVVLLVALALTVPSFAQTTPVTASSIGRPPTGDEMDKSPDAPDAGSEDVRQRFPGQVKDQLTAFEPALTPWPPLPPGLSFEDLMDRFFEAKNLAETGPDYQQIATPDWDTQHLIIGELFKMKRAKAVPQLLDVVKRRDKNLTPFAVELLAYFEDRSALPEVIKLARESDSKDVRIKCYVTMGRLTTCKEKDCVGGADATQLPIFKELYKKEQDPIARSVIVEQMDFVGLDEMIPWLCDVSKKDKDVNVRVSATYALTNFDRQASLECMIEATKSKDWEVREAACKVMARVAGSAAAAAMKEREKLYTPERLARVDLARTALEARVNDENEKVRMAATRSLYDISDLGSIPALTKALENGTVDQKELVTEVLARTRTAPNEKQPEGEFLPRPNEAVIDPLIKALENPCGAKPGCPDDQAERIAYQAARALGYTKSDKAVAALEKALSHRSQVVRTNAAAALGYIGTDQAVLALVSAADKADQRVQYAIAQALSMTKKPAAVAALMRMSRSGDINFRANAMSLLGEAKDPQAIPILRAALKEKDVNMRVAAIRGLGYLQDKTMLPELVRMLDDPSPQIRAAAVNAIVEFKDPSLTEIVARRLYDQDESVRSITLDALERQRDSKAVRYIMARLKAVHDDLDFAAMVAIGNITGYARDGGDPAHPPADAKPIVAGSEDDAVPFLVDNILVNNWQKRLAIMFALGRVGDDARAETALIKLLNDPVVDVRVSALDTIGILGAVSGRVSPAVIKAIKELRKQGDDRWVRDIAIVNLLKLGDQETIDEVVNQAKNDEDPEKRQYAVMYMQESDNKQLLKYLAEMRSDTDEIGLAITSIGLAVGGPPYYEASSGLYPKVSEYVNGAMRKISGFGHPAIDLEPKSDDPFYGIFETRLERSMKLEKQDQWIASGEMQKVIDGGTAPPFPIGTGTPSEPEKPKQP
ncbi:MAG: HEAT repeat domain-containing protein [Acidobacteriota bacterium]